MEDVKERAPICEFKTTDMPLITFLRYNGYIVQRINRINDYKAEFVFKNVDRNILDEFNADRSTVEPKMFSSIMKHQTAAAKRTIRDK